MRFLIPNDKGECPDYLIPGTSWKANDVQHMPTMRTYPHCLKADSVQVTFGKDSVIIRGFKQSMKNAREYNRRMGVSFYGLE